jgi:hypothetical protein
MRQLPEPGTSGRENWWVFAFVAMGMLLLSGNGQTARAGEEPWEKTAGPPGLEVTVIYETNKIVYAGTATH